MGTFDSSSVQDLKRLLELFPIVNLRHSWPDLKGTKEEICFAASESKDYARIAQFVDEHFSCCKQHVHTFMKPAETVGIPETLQGEPSAMTINGVRSLFILRARYTVVLREPLEETFIDFLWPIRLEITPDQVNAVLRFIVLEKAVTQYFDRPCYVPDRSIEEKAVVKEVEHWAPERADLHKGIKDLWETGFMDSSSAKLKKALSMASETMDEEKGIREHNPELYAEIQENTLLNALFAISDEKCGVSVLSVQPSNGYVAFPRYSEKGGTRLCYFRDSSKQSVICCPTAVSSATRKLSQG
jgi:hypothetical protein